MGMFGLQSRNCATSANIAAVSTSSTTFVTATGLTVALNISGKLPIFICLLPEETNDESDVFVDTNVAAQYVQGNVRLLRSATPVGNHRLGEGVPGTGDSERRAISIPVSSFWWLDNKTLGLAKGVRTWDVNFKVDDSDWTIFIKFQFL